MVMTAAMVVGLTAFALSGLASFTILAGMIVIISMTMLMFFILTFACGYYAYNTGWCVLAVILFGLYLVVDTMLIMG